MADQKTSQYTALVGNGAATDLIDLSKDMGGGTYASRKGTLTQTFGFISATGPMSFNATTGALTIAAASGSQAGAISSADWTAFNSKLSGNQTITLSGDVTGSGATAITATIAAGAVSLAKLADMATASILGRNTAGTGTPEVLSAATVKSLLSLGNVENTALSTWAGTANITTLGTIATGSWNATAIPDGKIASALTGKTYNALTLTAQAIGFTISGGTTSKTITVALDANVSGANTGDVTLGTGENYLSITGQQITAAAITLSGTNVTGQLPLAKGGTAANLTADQGGIVYSTASALAILAHSATANKVLMSGASAAPAWSTPSYPNASATAGKVIRSDGTNYSASSFTIPDTFTTGDLIQASATSVFSALAAVAIGNALISGGIGVVSAWGKIGLTTHVSGTLAEGNGGTNQSTYAIGDLLYSSATNTLAKLAGNTTSTKKFLTQTGTGSVSAAPAWNTILAADIPVFVASGASHASGAVPDPGSSAGSTKFLREDATWAVPAGGGAQTPWASDIDSAGFALTGVSGANTLYMDDGSGNISFTGPFNINPSAFPMPVLSVLNAASIGNDGLGSVTISGNSLGFDSALTVHTDDENQSSVCFYNDTVSATVPIFNINQSNAGVCYFGSNGHDMHFVSALVGPPHSLVLDGTTGVVTVRDLTILKVSGTDPIADGTYTTGIGHTITTKCGVITAAT